MGVFLALIKDTNKYFYMETRHWVVLGIIVAVAIGLYILRKIKESKKPRSGW